MARFFAFFTLFHLSLTFFRPVVPFNIGFTRLPLLIKTNTYILLDAFFWNIYRLILKVFDEPKAH